MDIRKLQRAIVTGLEDVKAQNIQVFNTEHLSPLFERVVVASGTSNRQTRALASSVRESVKKAGFDLLRVEGEDNGEWIIVDCGAAVVHVMQPAIRDYYNLEEIWGEKPVKLAAGKPKGLAKASETAAPVRTGKTAKPSAKAPAKPKASASRRSGSAAEALKNEPVAPRPSKTERVKAAAERRAPTPVPKQRVSSASVAKAGKAAPAAKTVKAVKAVKTVTAKPAAKSAAKSAAKPTAKTSTKPAAPRAAKTVGKTATKPVVKSAVKAAAKPASRPATKAVKKTAAPRAVKPR